MKNNNFDNTFNIESLIKEVATYPRIQELINDSQYYFQYLLDVKDKYFKYNITDAEIEKIIVDYETFNDGTFEDFVLQSEDSVKPFLETLAEYICYLDSKASGKNRWNKYTDKRTIARASVRMPHWVKNLLKLKLNLNAEISNSIKNAVEYSISPIKNFTILSENHRKSLSNIILKKKYDELTFQQELIEYFDSFGIIIKNKMNYTYIISSILYSRELKSIWNPKKDEELDIDDIQTLTTNSFFEKYKEFLTTSRGGEIASGTINSYYESAIHQAPKWMKRNGVIYEEIIKNNKTELLRLKETVNFNQSGFNGFLSFKWFVNEYVNFNMEKTPLNQILYGPPGTGKTYKTKKLAVEIIETKTYSDSQEDRDIIIEKYDEYIKTNQIHFTTFHQSMSYEDFIEGIKPETVNENVTYDVKDGVFKQIC